MTSKRALSEPRSDLVRLFVERSGVRSRYRSPADIMAAVVEGVPGGKIRNQEQRLQRVLRERNVVQVEVISNLNYDGMLEPIGATFSDGFRLRLKKDVSPARLRFSLGHELCHTFFYELVPEIKFRNHEVDDAEERLCNFGAAVLLVPARTLRARTRKLPICMASLEQLAKEYSVSLPTMLLRLRALGLWDCELSSWHRGVAGNFALDGLYGGRRAKWEWEDLSELERAWRSNEPVFGTGFVYLADAYGARRYKPISYNLSRSGGGIIALWGTGIRKPAKAYPLLQSVLQTGR
jgi:Zn-dependent peptidase ImmA (M78 family)